MRALLASALLAGCALNQPAAERPLGRGEILSAATARSMLVVGESTKSEVRAMLGEATVVDFPSRYEVWVYRQAPKEKPAAPGAELVLLFDDSGTLSKTRVTPQPARRP